VKHIAALLISAAILLFLGCGAPEHSVPVNQPPVEEPVEKLTFVSYELIRVKVLRPYCLSCHSGKEKPDLRSYELVKEKLPAIRHSVFELADGEKKKMPPANRQHLSANAKNILKTWLDLDGPEAITAVGDVINEPPADPMDVSWSQVKREVFDKSCNRCHSAGNDWNAIDYTKVGEVKNVFNTIMTFVLFGNTMPPRQDPPKPLPADWLDNEAIREDPNPNVISNEQKLLLYKWFLNGLTE
jgi:hypothetical protein